ncbi:MAG: hypothetical protein ABSH47_26815, partial [Bryobacteraceae bacterium]
MLDSVKNRRLIGLKEAGPVAGEFLAGDTTMSWNPLVLATLAVIVSFVGAYAQESGPYKVLKIQLVGGDGGFDYVTADPDGRNLYVARSGP